MAPKQPPKPKRLGDMNGWTPIAMKLFLISWPVFLTTFFAALAWAINWGAWVTTEIKDHGAFITYGPRFSQKDAREMADKLRDEWHADLLAVIREIDSRHKSDLQ